MRDGARQTNVDPAAEAAARDAARLYGRECCVQCGSDARRTPKSIGRMPQNLTEEEGAFIEELLKSEPPEPVGVPRVRRASDADADALAAARAEGYASGRESVLAIVRAILAEEERAQDDCPDCGKGFMPDLHEYTVAVLERVVSACNAATGAGEGQQHATD